MQPESARFLPPGLSASLSGPIAHDLSETGIAEVAMSVFGDPDVVPLWFGEGDLVTPGFVRDAAAKALQAGETFYTWQRGIPELRAALSAYTERLYGINCPTDRISVTTGGMQAILLSCQLLLDPGDNIVIVSPIWPNITSAARLVRGEPKYVALDRKPDGSWSSSTSRRSSTPSTSRTRAIFVNSPGNPTGWTMTSEEQRAILDFARKRGIWIMADEVYGTADLRRRAAWRRRSSSIAEPDDPLIVLNSFSKPWAMTGWRIGWLTHPPALGDQIAKLVQINTSGVPAFLQRGAVAALEKGDDFHRRDGRPLPRRPRAGVPAPVGQSAHLDRAAGGGVLQLLFGRRRHRHDGLLQEAREGLQGRPGAGRGLRRGRAGQHPPLLRLGCRAAEPRSRSHRSGDQGAMMRPWSSLPPSWSGTCARCTARSSQSTT